MIKMIKNNKLKELKSQLKKVDAEIEFLKMQASNAQRNITLQTQEKSKLDSEISKLNNSDSLSVSDHAIVRYLERVKRLDIESIKEEILEESVVSQIYAFGGRGNFPSPNQDFKMVVKDYIVVTII